MFAVAIWDRHKQQLVLGRDRVGKKPLVYHHSPEGLTFASELQALKRLPTVSTDLDPFALAWYFGGSRHRCRSSGIGNRRLSGSFVV